MPSNARWRHLKIVAPETPNQEKELIGGLKNALERGEKLEKAKQSFINAGYNIAEVEAAIKKMPAITQKTNLQTTPISQTPTPQAPISQIPTPQALPTTDTKPKQVSKKFTIILIISVILILITAAFLGLFWNKIF